MPSFGVATFNCEWRRSSSAAATIIRERIVERNPHVVCITEAYHDFFGDSGYTIEAVADYGYPVTVGRRKVLLWSRTPWKQVDRIGDPNIPSGRFVAGSTLTPLGEVRVIGVCIPWSRAHVRDGRRDRTLWQDHLQYLTGLDTILALGADRLLVMGDFNQRLPRNGQPQVVYDALSRVTSERLVTATAGMIFPMAKQTIDHICHSHDLRASEVEGISNLGPDGAQLSDHFGISARVSKP